MRSIPADRAGARPFRLEVEGVGHGTVVAVFSSRPVVREIVITPIRCGYGPNAACRAETTLLLDLTPTCAVIVAAVRTAHPSARPLVSASRTNSGEQNHPRTRVRGMRRCSRAPRADWLREASRSLHVCRDLSPPWHQDSDPVSRVSNSVGAASEPVSEPKTAAMAASQLSISSRLRRAARAAGGCHKLP